MFLGFQSCLTAEETLQPIIKIGKDVPKDKAQMLTSRIDEFFHIVTHCDFSPLEYLWHNTFDDIKFDGNFMLSYSNLDYTNNIPGTHKKFGKKDVTVLLCHRAGEEYNHYPPNCSQNYVMLCILNQSILASYYEFGKIVNESFGVRFCEETGYAEKLQLTLNVNKEKSTKENALIQWDKNGSILSTDKAETIDKLRKLPDKSIEHRKKTATWGKKPQMPVCPDKNTKELFDRMTMILAAKKMDDILNLFELPLLKSADVKSCQLSYNEWHCQWICLTATSLSGDDANVLQGYTFVLNDDGLPIFYIEGMFSMPNTFFSLPELESNGVQIKFHTNGTPSTYKTIVRNRLFGRQIEWDEKGNVISDVDLDIPKPWPGAPKSPEESEQVKNKPAPEDTKPISVMREWMSADGKSKTTAKIVTKTDETVTLENEAGKRVDVKIERLSESDREYVKSWKQPER